MNWLDKRFPVSTVADTQYHMQRYLEQQVKRLLGSWPHLCYFDGRGFRIYVRAKGQSITILDLHQYPAFTQVPGLVFEKLKTPRQCLKYLEKNKNVIRAWLVPLAAEEGKYQARLKRQRDLAALRRAQERAVAREAAAPKAEEALKKLSPKMQQKCLGFYKAIYDVFGDNLLVDKTLEAMKDYLAPYTGKIQVNNVQNAYPYSYLAVGNYASKGYTTLTFEKAGLILWTLGTGVLKQWNYSPDLDLMAIAEEIKSLLILNRVAHG